MQLHDFAFARKAFSRAGANLLPLPCITTLSFCDPVLPLTCTGSRGYSFQMSDCVYISCAGNFKAGAKCALQAAAVLQAAGNDAEARRWLQRAARQYRSARMFDECLALLQQHPEVAEALPAEEVTFRHSLPLVPSAHARIDPQIHAFAHGTRTSIWCCHQVNQLHL